MSARSSLTLRVVRWLAATAIAGATAAALLLGGLYLYLSPRLPEIDQLRDVQLQEPLRVYSRGGELLAVYGTKRRRPLPLDEIPERLQNAFIAAEDDRFYEHPGVDWMGLVRAGVNLIMTGEKGQGGSTITMQVARNFFLSREKTYLRKINEIFLALKIEREIDKDEILELYLNKIYLGQRAYGVGAAAQVYYGREVADLTLPGVWHVDPTSGARTVVSGPNVGSGPSFFNVSGIALANDGTLVVSDLILGVLVVDPSDGTRTLLSGDGEGTGPAFEDAAGLAVHRTLITDFSTRVDLTSATIDVDTFPLELWRYLDLSQASIEGAEGVELSTVEMPLDLSGIELNGATGLSGAILDGADFSCATPSETDRNCAQLYDAVMNQVSLQGAVLTDADMSGIRLIRANLAAADLSGALLLKSPTTLTAANLQGSYLKDANLANADLSGATLTNANWYSTSPGTCSPAAWTGKCATGEGATLSDADFSGAYLAGVDLSSSTAQGTKFTGAILAGATFDSANLTGDPNTGASASLAGAFLQGVNFTDAQVGGTDFSSAYVDLTSTNGGTLVWELPSANLSFTGYTPPQTPPNCPFVTYSDQTSVGTLSGNVCPDGNNGEDGGSCSMTQWLAPLTPLDMATPPASDELSMLPGDCTALNFDW